VNGRRFLADRVPIAGPFDGPVALRTGAVFPEVRRLLTRITTGTFLHPEEVSS
jgi:hypothetical protein